MRRHLLGTILCTALAAPVFADGGAALVVGAPRGALGRAADVAGGLAGHLLLPAGGRTLALRLDGSWLLYGSETVRIPLPRTGGRIAREIVTDNWMAQLGVGPQVVLPLGRIRPYLHAFAGVSYLSTTSQLRDPDFFVSRPTTNFDDTALAYGGGGGLLVPLRGRGMSLDLGARYVRTSTVRFLGEGDLGRDGGASATPNRGQANVLEFRLGLTFN
jgi:hypothetical protein